MLVLASLWKMDFPAWQFVVRSAVVYVAVLFLLRLGGKRQIGQMGTGEFVAILLISNAVQNSMNGNDSSITGGLILAAVIVGLSVLVDYLSFKSDKFENVVQGTPTLLIHHGRILHKHLERERLNMHEFQTVLRRQGIYDLDEVAEAILESDGQITVTKKSEVPRKEPETDIRDDQV